MSTIEVLSYIANIVFVTSEIIGYFSHKREKKVEANSLIAVYEMATRMSAKVPGFFKDQAQDIACSIKSSILSARGRERRDIDFEVPVPDAKSEIKKSRSA